jgi:hypothetical protein
MIVKRICVRARRALERAACSLLLCLLAQACYVGGGPPQSCKQVSVGDTELQVENQLGSGLEVQMDDDANRLSSERFEIAPASCETHAISAARWNIELSQCDWAEGARCETFGPVLEATADIKAGQARTLVVTPSMFGL